MGIDDSTGKLYLPTAEMEPPAPGAAIKTAQAKARTFMIVDVGQK